MTILTIDQDSAELLLGMLVKDQKLFKLAADYINPEAFQNLFPEREDFFLFWFVLAPAVKKYGSLKLSKDLVKKGSGARLAMLYEDPSERAEKVEYVVDLYNKVEQLDVTPDKQMVMDFIRIIMQKGSVLPQLTQIVAAAEFDGDVTSAVTKATQLSRQLGPTQRPVIDPFDLATLPPQEEETDLVKTYIDWFDAACGGGLYREEPHTIVLPTGEGKTTLSCQIAAFRARKGEKTLVVITEGGVNRKMTSKVQGALLQMPCKAFDRDDTSPLRDPSSLTPTHLNYLANARGATRYIDLVDHGEGVSWLDFVREYERCIDEGFQPGLVIIDWAGLLAKSLVDNGVYRDQHMALEHIAISCTNFCKETRVPILITQQVTAAIAEQKGIRPTYTVQDVDGCKKWANHFCTAMIATKFDSNNYGTAFFEKTRYSEGSQKVILKRRGDISTFIKAPESVRWAGSRYVDADEQFGDADNAAQSDFV